MSARGGRRGWKALAIAALLLGAGLGGCKEKESLVVVTVTANYIATTLASARISVGTHAETFALPATIPSAGVSFGVYVPSSIKGGQTITVVASPPTAGDCNGGTGDGYVIITTVGEPYGPVTIPLYPSTSACATGGRSGTGGSVTGTGGSGTGGSGTGGAGGGITKCNEYDHGDSGQCAMAACTGDYAVYGAAFSPVNAALAVTSGRDGRTKVWTVSNGSMVPEGHVVPGGSGYNVVAFSPDGTLLAIGQQGGVQIVDVATWMGIRTLTVADTVYGVAFSPDGTQVITLDADDLSPPPYQSHLYVHAVTNTTALHSVTLTNGFALAVSPVASATGLQIAVPTDVGTALVYTLSASGFSSPTTLTVTSDASVAEAAQFSPSGTVLAAGGNDGYLRFWPTPPTGAAQGPTINVPSVTNTLSDDVYAVAFSPDGSELAIGGGVYGSVTTYATGSRTQIGVEQDTTSGSDVLSLGYSPDSKYIIGGEANCGCVFLCKH